MQFIQKQVVPTNFLPFYQKGKMYSLAQYKYKYALECSWGNLSWNILNFKHKMYYYFNKNSNMYFPSDDAQ